MFPYDCNFGTSSDIFVASFYIFYNAIFESKTLININIFSFFSSLVCLGLGLVVLLDIAHSYASADELVGLSLFDGSNDCYFHSGIIT